MEGIIVIKVVEVMISIGGAMIGASVLKKPKEIFLIRPPPPLPRFFFKHPEFTEFTEKL